MRWLVLGLGAVLLAGCATMTNPLAELKADYKDVPIDDLRAVAQEIESAIQQGNRTPQVADRNGVVVNDEQIMQAIRTRAARVELLNEFRSSGFAVEQRSGLVKIITNKEYKSFGSGRDRDRNALLVTRENADRWALYEGILKKSNFSPKALDVIQTAFYEARVAVLPAGQKYEDESGNDVVK